MLNIVTIAGCPSLTSSSTAVLSYAHTLLARSEVKTEEISVRQLPADDLMLGRAYSAPLRQSVNLIKQADAVIVATSICKATYTGGLKAFLDLLTQDAFSGKIVLPIAIGASAAHFREMDHSLRVVLGTLGADHILEGVYLLERQVQLYDRQVHLDELAKQRVHRGLENLLDELSPQPIVPSFPFWGPLMPLAMPR
jgi:FMN reductase